MFNWIVGWFKLSIKLKERCGEELRNFICKKQWEGYSKGPEIIHTKIYPVISESDVRRDIDVFEKTFNPELKLI